jgi:hypothetical protein
MFSRIPQRFTAPFGLLGDEAKLAFPSQPGGIAKLAAVRVSEPIKVDNRGQLVNADCLQNIPDSDNYWNQVSFTL